MSDENKDRVNRVSFSLEPEYQELLTKIAKKRRMNKTAVMRQMIDDMAITIGLKPVVPAIKKEQGSDD